MTKAEQLARFVGKHPLLVGGLGIFVVLVLFAVYVPSGGSLIAEGAGILFVLFVVVVLLYAFAKNTVGKDGRDD